MIIKDNTDDLLRYSVLPLFKKFYEHPVLETKQIDRLVSVVFDPSVKFYAIASPKLICMFNMGHPLVSGVPAKMQDKLRGGNIILLSTSFIVHYIWNKIDKRNKLILDMCEIRTEGL